MDAECKTLVSQCGQDVEFHTVLSWPEPRFERSVKIVLDKLTDLYWPANARLAEFPLEWAEAHRFIEEMNAAAELGYSDWQLQNRRELRSLICHQSRRPALPGAHPFTQVDRVYWSSTTSLYDPDWAWALYLDVVRSVLDKKRLHASGSGLLAMQNI